MASLITSDGFIQAIARRGRFSLGLGLFGITISVAIAILFGKRLKDDNNEKVIRAVNNPDYAYYLGGY